LNNTALENGVVWNEKKCVEKDLTMDAEALET
jgi:hypothetical protein